MNNNINKENETNKNEIVRGVRLEEVTPKLVEQSLIDYSENAKYNVDYFSVYCSQLRDYCFMDKIEEFGAHYFLFLQYLKMEMLDFAKFYILEKNIKRLIKQYCCNFSANENEIRNIYDDLIKSKYISVISVNSFDCDLIVEPVVFYNYRLTNEQRLKNRERQAKTREKKKLELEELQEKVANFESENIEPAPTAPAEISQDNFNDFTVVNAEAENDNIFDEIEKESLVQKKKLKKYLLMIFPFLMIFLMIGLKEVFKNVQKLHFFKYIFYCYVSIVFLINNRYIHDNIIYLFIIIRYLLLL